MNMRPASSMDKSSGGSGGLSFGFAVFLILLIFKLTHLIDWSWWLVTAPLWAPTAGMLVVLAVLKVAIAGLERLDR